MKLQAEEERLSVPKRKSIGPVYEDLENYNFPESSKAKRKERVSRFTAPVSESVLQEGLLPPEFNYFCILQQADDKAIKRKKIDEGNQILLKFMNKTGNQAEQPNTVSKQSHIVCTFFSAIFFTVLYCCVTNISILHF